MLVDFYPTPGQPMSGVAAAAGAGYDGYWTSEVSHDPFLPIAVAASQGNRIDLGTAIAVAFARSPMTLAYTAWDLAAATEGRFILGLGSQIRAHIVGRFAMPWSAPVERMRDYIGALRAIWGSWQTGERLRYRSEHYRFSLMTPFFSPGAISHPEIPIFLAAVGTGMAKLAGEVADGVHVHPFHTRQYLERVVVPAIAGGAEASGRDPARIALAAPLFVITGTGTERDRAADQVRRQIAFYASTPAYRGVLDLHGWEIGDRLNEMSKRGQWEEMAGLVTDEILHSVAVVAPLDHLAEAIGERCCGLIDRVGLYPGGGVDPLDPAWLEVMAEIRSLE